MIISHRHKFIFIKTNKTAGTSIEIALSKYCGEDDIITGISPDDEVIRKNLGYRGPQHHKKPFSLFTFKDWRKCVRKMKRPNLSPHTSIKTARKLTSENNWRNYFKFCFERNPWDRVISSYYFRMSRWKKKNEKILTLSEYLDSDWILSLKRHGLENYTIDNEIAVDRVCLYENLEEEMNEVCRERLGIKDRIELPKAKSTYRKDKRHYREVLDDNEKEKIAGLFKREIELFGYKY